MTQKNKKKLYWACDNAGTILYLIKNRKYTLFYCIKYFLKNGILFFELDRQA